MSTIKAGTTSTTAYQVEADTTGELVFKTGASATTALTINSSQAFTFDGAAVFNESGADKDFRIEGDTDANLFFADASTDRIGIGISSPSEKVHLFGSATATSPRILIQSHDTASATAGLLLYGRDASNVNKVCEIATSNDDLIFKTNNATVATLDQSGNLGLGVTPSAWSGRTAIQVVNAFVAGISTAAIFGANNYYDGSVDKYTATGPAQSLVMDSGGFKFLLAGSGTAGNTISFTQAMTLDASGNLLVGVTSISGNIFGSNTGRLFASSSSAGFAAGFRNSSASGTIYGIGIQYTGQSPNGTGNEFLVCEDSGPTVRASIRSNGGIANYQTNDVNLSDERVKQDIKPLGSMWGKFKALEIVTFKYKDQTHDDDNIGVIAQQVESVAPEFVDADGWGETPDDGVPLKSVYTADMYHAAIKALQEAMARIEKLEAEVAALKAG